MFVITLNKAHNCLSFWTVLPNVEPCGDNLEQNESSIKTANASPSSTTSQSGWAAAGVSPRIIVESMGLITVQDIVNLCQHTQGFFQHALNLEDMEVGAWICTLHFYYISHTIQLVSVILLSVICLVFVVLRNWYVIKLEVLKLICTVLFVSKTTHVL